MTLNHLFKLLLSTFIAFLVLAGFAHFVLFGRIEASNKYLESLFDLDNSLTRLAGVQTDYLVRCAARAGKQWRVLHKQIDDDIGKLVALDEQSSIHSGALRASHVARLQAFELVCRPRNEVGSSVSSLKDHDPVAKLALAKLITETQVSSFEIEQVHQLADRRHARIYRQLLGSYAALWLLMSVIVLVSFLLIRKRVVVPIGAMMELVSDYGKGDFNARVPDEGNDEIAELGRALNQMAASVTSLTVSQARFSKEVSQRRNSEQRLRFLLDRYRLIMDGAGVGIWDWDVPAGTVEFSSLWKHMRGFSDSEVGNELENWSNGIHPDDRERVMAAVQAHFNGISVVFEEEYRVQCKDGAWMWVLDRGASKHDEEGQVVRMAGTETDITGQRLESMHQAVVMDISQRLVGANHAGDLFDTVVDSFHRHSNFPIIALELYDPQQDEMVFQSSLGLPPELQGARVPSAATLSGLVVQQGRTLVESNALARPEYRYEALRSLQVMSFVCAPLKLKNGQVLGALSVADTQRWRRLEQLGRIVTDIAERLAGTVDQSRLEQQVNQNAEKLRLVYESMSEGLFYLRRDGALIDCNPAALDLLGVSREQFLSRRFDDAAWRVIDESGKEIGPEEFPSAVALRTGKPVYSRALGIFNERRDDYLWLHVNAIPLFNDYEAEASEVFVTLHDVNERMQKERLADQMRAGLAQAQKMQSVGLLTGGIAHDFNNLLGIILGHIELLGQDLAGTGRDSSLRRLQHIRHSADRAVKLVRQLLGFSRQKPAHSEICSLNQLLQDIDELLRRAVTPAIEVEWALGQGAWLVEIDAGDFQDAVLNLVTNAGDAMPSGGRIRIETRNMVLDDDFCKEHAGAAPGAYVRLTVSDTGQGIDAQALPRIFEPFYTSKPTGKGTGLGLAMVYGFCKRSSGYIEAESKPGMGTAMRLYLPRADGAGRTRQDAPSPAAQAEPVEKAEATVLIVDDEAELRELARDMLTPLGYRIMLAASAERALATLAAEPAIDLLFSDIVMPGGMDGFELAEQVRRLYPEVKILLTSGYSKKLLDERRDDPGTARILAKPYSSRQLIGELARLLQHPREDKGSDGGHSFEWREEFSIGVEAMDEDHREILGLQRQLKESVESRDNEATLRFMDQLQEAMLGHFEREEALMRSRAYSGVDNHREVHQMLLRRIDEMKSLALNDRLDVAATVDFLKNWWMDHTQGMDRAYAAHLEAQAMAEPAQSGGDRERD